MQHNLIRIMPAIFLFAAVFPAFGQAPSLVTPPRVQQMPAPPPEYAVQGRLMRGRILVPVHLNGAGPHFFLLDLSTPQPVVDTRIAAQLGLRPDGETLEADDPAGRPVRAQVSEAVLNYGNVPAERARLVVHDLQAISQWLGMQVAGVLPGHRPGLEVTLDFVTGVVEWRPLETALLQREDEHTLRMRIDEQGAPTIPVLLERRHLLQLQLDLACSGAVGLRPATLRELGIGGDAPRLEVLNSRQAQVRLNELSAGGKAVLRPLCTVLPEESPDRLGLGFLEHFRLTLNYESGLCRLTPISAEAFSEPPLTGYGIAPHRMDSGYWRLHVVSPSPAAAAGIMTGDYLLGVNGGDAAHSAHATVARLLSAPPGTPVALTIGRGNQRQTFQLVSAEYFP